MSPLASLSPEEIAEPSTHGPAFETHPDAQLRVRPAALSARQAAFAAHYVDCANGAEAARRAGYAVDSARYAARDNLKDTRIRQRIRDLAADQHAARRDEATYLLQMLNAAMEMALHQQMPNTMIRALAQMARIAGLDRPPRQVQPPPARRDSLDDGLDDSIDGDGWLALHADWPPGMLQDALEDSHPDVPAMAGMEAGPELWGAPGAAETDADAYAETGTGTGIATGTGAPTFPHKTPHPDISSVPKDEPPQASSEAAAATPQETVTQAHKTPAAIGTAVTALRSTPSSASGSGKFPPDARRHGDTHGDRHQTRCAPA